MPKLSDRYHLIGASTLSCPNKDGEVSFRLLNPSDTPIILYKGSTIGKFEEICSDDEIVSLEPGSEPDVSPIDAPWQGQSEIPKANFLSGFKSLPSPALSSAENTQLSHLLESYSDIFASSSLDLGHTTLIQHQIDTGDAQPIKQAPYRVPQAQRAEIDKHISNMLDQNIISVSTSPWSSPVVLVKKKGGTTRFCIDYHKLNAVTRKDSYPLPRIDDALDALSGSKYFQRLIYSLVIIK